MSQLNHWSEKWTQFYFRDDETSLFPIQEPLSPEVHTLIVRKHYMDMEHIQVSIPIFRRNFVSTDGNWVKVTVTPYRQHENGFDTSEKMNLATSKIRKKISP